MRIAIGSDEKTSLTHYIIEEIAKRGHKVVTFGALKEQPKEVDWPLVSAQLAQAVSEGKADEGILFCWTGTGACIAANKIPNVRAALCADAETAKGARTWNHANVLVLSLRLISKPVAREILEAWFSTPYSEDDWNLQQIERIKEIESTNKRAC